MKSEQAWQTIISKLMKNELEIPTSPMTKRIPVWFNASTDGEIIFINKAVKNSPSSRLSMQRKLKYSTFEKVYPLYIRRENGEQISKEVSSITVNSVYYFSIIKNLL